MSDFTESNNDDSAASAYCEQAKEAFHRGELEYAEELYRKAAKLYEQAGNDAVSRVYSKLGSDEYWRGDLDAAEEWYRKSLEIDERTGDELGAAKTYHYLSHVANGRGDFESAEKWLWKSIHIKEKQGDQIGAAHSYHQLGVVANDRENFDAAEKWYFKSLEIKGKLGDEVGMAHTYFNLSTNARDQENSEAAEEWLQTTVHVYEKKGEPQGVVGLGWIAEEAREFGLAERLYQEALRIAKCNANDEYEAYSYQHLGHLACLQYDFETSKKWYEIAFETNERRGAMDWAAKCCLSVGNVSLGRTTGKPRDLAAAKKKWFRKALELDRNATWRDWLTLYGRLWRYRLLSVFSK